MRQERRYQQQKQEMRALKREKKERESQELERQQKEEAQQKEMKDREDARQKELKEKEDARQKEREEFLEKEAKLKALVEFSKDRIDRLEAERRMAEERAREEALKAQQVANDLKDLQQKVASTDMSAELRNELEEAKSKELERLRKAFELDREADRAKLDKDMEEVRLRQAEIDQLKQDMMLSQQMSQPANDDPDDAEDVPVAPEGNEDVEELLKRQHKYLNDCLTESLNFPPLFPEHELSWNDINPF